MPAPDYTSKADADGVAQINGVQPGTYYVAATNGNYSNIFATYTEKVDGMLIGYAADTVLDDAGSLIWKDLIMDGTLSDDATCGEVTSNCPLDDFSVTADMTVFNTIWSGGYFKGIHKLNEVIYDLNALSGQSADMAAQAAALRDYIYLQMLTYFGDVPMSNGDMSADFYPGVIRKPAGDVYTAIASDLANVVKDLPSTRADNKQALTSYAVRAIGMHLCCDGGMPSRCWVVNGITGTT